MADDLGPSDHHFVVEGMEQFTYLERVLRAPYEKLIEAHHAAMAVLDTVD